MLKVITLMLEDEELKDLVGSHIFPTPTEFLGECVLYDFHTTNDNKITQNVRLELNIITETMEKSLMVEKRIKKLLLTLGDDPLTTDVLQVEVNGGGTLLDIERNKRHRILYFEIIKRSDSYD